MKKENIKLSLFITLIVVFSLSVTYAFLEFNASGEGGSGEAGCFVVNYSGQSINNSALPSTTDYTQGATSDIILSKNEDCEIYTEALIYMHTDTTLTDIPYEKEALKYKILQGETEIASGVIQDPTVTGTADQLLLTEDPITLTEDATTYTVYLWVDSSASQGAFNGKNYSGYIYAVSNQSSTVTS